MSVPSVSILKILDSGDFEKASAHSLFVKATHIVFITTFTRPLFGLCWVCISGCLTKKKQKQNLITGYINATCLVTFEYSDIYHNKYIRHLKKKKNCTYMITCETT